jgi:hypothetical protein
MALAVLLFAARVLGQALVTYAGVTWLPPVEQWQSGLLPYPLLLFSQAVILLVLGLATRDVWRSEGVFARERPRLSVVIRWASFLYAAAMIARYVAQISLHPEWFPFSHSIPIVFHLLLALWLYLYSRAIAVSPQPRA